MAFWRDKKFRKEYTRRAAARSFNPEVRAATVRRPPVAPTAQPRPAAPPAPSGTPPQTPVAAPTSYTVIDRTKKGKGLSPTVVNVETYQGASGIIHWLQAGADVVKGFLGQLARRNETWNRVARVSPVIGDAGRLVWNSITNAGLDTQQRALEEAKKRETILPRSQVDQTLENINRQRADTREDERRLRSSWEALIRPTPYVVDSKPFLDVLQKQGAKVVAEYVPASLHWLYSPDQQRQISEGRAELDASAERTKTLRENAMTALRLGDMPMARRALRAAMDDESQSAAVDPTWAYSFVNDPARREAYMEALVDAELEKVSATDPSFQVYTGLDYQEKERIKDYFVDPVQELPGELLLDLYNVVPVEWVVKPVFAGARLAGKGVVKVASRLPIVGGGVRWLSKQAVESAAEMVGRGVMDASSRVARAASTVQGGQGSLVAQMDVVAAAILSGDGARLPASIGKRELDFFRQANRIIPAQDWGATIERTVTRVREEVFQAELKRQIGNGLDDATAMRVATDLAEQYTQNPSNIAREFASAVKDEYLRRQMVPGLSHYYDSTVGLMARAFAPGDVKAHVRRLIKSGTDVDEAWQTAFASSRKHGNFVRMLDNIGKVADTFQRWWSSLVLPARPAWSINNFFDSMGRYLLSGGRLFDDLGSIFDTAFERAVRSEFIVPTDLTDVFARSGLAPEEGVAQRLIGGWKPTSPFSFHAYEWRRLRGKADEAAQVEMEKVARGLQSLNPILRKGEEISALMRRYGNDPTKIPADGWQVLKDLWGSWINGWRDFNAATEFTLRLRLYHNKVTSNFVALETREAARIFGGLPDHLKPVAKSLWMEAGHDPERFKQMLAEIVGTATEGRKLEWSALVPPDLDNRLLDLPMDARELLVRQVVMGLERVRAAAGGRLTPEQIDTFFKDVGRLLDELVLEKTQRSEEAAKPIAEALATAPVPVVRPFEDVVSSLSPKRFQSKVSVVSDFAEGAARVVDVQQVDNLPTAFRLDFSPDGRPVWSFNPSLIGKVKVRDLRASMQSALEASLYPAVQDDGFKKLFADATAFRAAFQFLSDNPEAFASKSPELYKEMARLLDRNRDTVRLWEAVTGRRLPYEAFSPVGEKNFIYDPLDLMTDEGRRRVKLDVEEQLPKFHSPDFHEAGRMQAAAMAGLDEVTARAVAEGAATVETQKLVVGQMRAFDNLQAAFHSIWVNSFPGPNAIVEQPMRGYLWEIYERIATRGRRAAVRLVEDIQARVVRGEQPDPLTIEAVAKRLGFGFVFNKDGTLRGVTLVFPNGTVERRFNAKTVAYVQATLLEGMPEGMTLRDAVKVPWTDAVYKVPFQPEVKVADVVDPKPNVRATVPPDAAAELKRQELRTPMQQAARLVRTDPLAQQARRFEIMNFLSELHDLPGTTIDDWWSDLVDRYPHWYLIDPKVYLNDLSALVSTLEAALKGVVDVPTEKAFLERLDEIISARLVYGDEDALYREVVPPNPYILKRLGLDDGPAREAWRAVYNADDVEAVLMGMREMQLADELDEAWRAFVRVPRLGDRSLLEVWGKNADSYHGFLSYLESIARQAKADFGEERVQDLLSSLRVLWQEANAFRSTSAKALSRLMPDAIFRQLKEFKTRYPVPIPYWELPDDTRTWLLRSQDVVAERSRADEFLSGWSEWLRNQAATGEGVHRVSDAADLAMLRTWMDDAVKAKYDITNAAVYGGEVGGETVRGALSQVNESMLDYGDYNRFDNLMKGLFPFWMFPSRSLPFWVEYMTSHPWLPAFYAKYVRHSQRMAYQGGATTTDGKPLPSLEGYIPIPGTTIWINPLAPMSFRYALPRVSARYDEGGQELTPLQQVYDYLREVGSYFGFSLSPWVTTTMVVTGIQDTERIPAWAIIPQLDLIPPYYERRMLEWVTRAAFPNAKEFWNTFISPEVGWKDFLIERQMLRNALQQMQTGNLTEVQKQALAFRVEEALKGRESQELWLTTRDQVDDSEYYKKLAGYFTGFFTREHTDADATFIQLRDEINLLRESINNETKARIFDLSADAEERYQSWINGKYRTPDGYMLVLYGDVRYVKTPDDLNPDKEQRRDIIAQKINDHQVTRAYYDALAVLGAQLNERLASLPVGADTKARDAVWDWYWPERHKIENEPMYAVAQRSWVAGEKPQGMVERYYEDEWFQMLRETKPKWDKSGGETYDDWQVKVEEWRAALPYQAEKLQAVFIQSETDRIRRSGDSPEFVASELSSMQTAMERLKTATTPDAYDQWEMSRDTTYDALDRAWKELRWDVYWDGIRGKSGAARRLFEHEFVAKPEPSAEELADWVLSKYPAGQYRREDLIAAAKAHGVTTLEDRLEPQDEHGKAVDDAYTVLSWLPPGKARSRLYEEYVRLGGKEDDFSVFYDTGGAWRDEEKLYAFVDRLKQAAANLNLTEPSRAELEVYVAVAELNDRFRIEAAKRLGEDIWQVIGAYGAASSSERRAMRRQDKRIDAYYDFRDDWGVLYPEWAQYYTKDGASGGGSVTSRAVRSGGGGGGGGGGGWYSSSGSPRGASYVPGPVSADEFKSALTYFEMIRQDGDWENEWRTRLSGEVRTAAEALGRAMNEMEKQTGQPLDWESLYKYIDAVQRDGDWANDWRTHLPEQFRPLIEALGKAMVSGGQVLVGGGGGYAGGSSGSLLFSSRFYDWLDAQAEARWPGIAKLFDQFVNITVLQGYEAGLAFWNMHPQLAEYDDFKDQMKKRRSDALKGVADAEKAFLGVGGYSGGGSGSDPIRDLHEALAQHFLPLGNRSSLNPSDLLNPQRFARGGISGKPIWTDKFLKTVSPVVIAEVQSGQPLSEPAVEHLKGIAVRHPEMKAQVEAMIDVTRLHGQSAA